MLNRPNRLVIFGSRGVDPYVAEGLITRQYSYIIAKLLFNIPEASHWPLDLVSGCCRDSPDMVPFILSGAVLPVSGRPSLYTGIVHKFPVTEKDWREHGKAAGPKRNTVMADFSDFGIAVYNGKSRGTHDMIVKLVKRRKPVAIVYSVTGAVSFC